MFVPYQLKTGVRAVTLALALATASLSANAVLHRVGPVDNAPSVGGFPSWFQDSTGLALEFCDPKNAAEVDGGWCLLLPGDVPSTPEVFPTKFFDEHFYFAAGASVLSASQTKGVLVLAQESAFATGPARPGDQIAFARIRVVLTPAPATGTYRLIHPYGEEQVEAVAGGKIFFTDDVGIACAQGSFECALNSRLGPFLLPSATPGGAEMPPVTAANPTPDTNPAHFDGAFQPTPYPGTGKAYIADPGRVGPVTGSPLPNFTDSSGALRNHNIFRIEGPVGSNLGGPGIDFLETTNFSLMGRVYGGTIPGKVDVERASYTRSATGQQVDVIANAFPTAVGRLPAGPVPAPQPPQLTFFDAPCAGTVDAAGNLVPPFAEPVGATETQMFANGSHYWGQVSPAVLPTAVCVKDGSARDINGNVVPNFALRQISDEVSVSQAAYDPATGALTVTASSSDTLVPPTLSLAYGNFRGDLSGGQITLPVVVVPPASVQVQSSAKGFRNQKVAIGAAHAAPTGAAPVAFNDSAILIEDSGSQQIAVLSNDVNAAGGTVTLTTAPVLGTAVVNADGSVTYTPRLNASGNDVITYTVTAGTQVSNTGTLSITITPVNDAPVAVNDRASAVVNAPTAINVLANDTDPDGATDLAAAVALTQPGAGATVSVVGGVVTFNATATGTYNFTYRAQDKALANSANVGTVTVTVSGVETVSIGRAEYVATDGRIRVEGSISPAANQTISVEFVNATGTSLGAIGSTVVPAGGNWSYLATGVTRPTGATAVRATSSNGTTRTFNLSIK